MKEQIRESELIDMQLHEVNNITDYLQIVRVIGGWIYNQYVSESATMTSTFVPEER